MKNFILILAIAMFTTLSAEAQVKSDTRTMVAGPQPCLTITLPDTDPKFAQSEWKEYMKPYGRLGSVKGSKEMIVEDIHINAIGDGSLIKVYNLAEESVDGTRMIVWFDIGDGYLTETDSNYHIAEDFLLKFAHTVKVNLVAMDLEAQEKILEKLESNMASLKRQNDNLNETIENSKSNINEAEIGIPMNETHQENTRSEIEAQRDNVHAARDDEKAVKEEQKKLAKLQSSLDKLEKENDNFHKSIESNKAKITKAEQDIVENLQEQESVSSNIESQKAIVAAVQNKLNLLKQEEQ